MEPIFGFILFFVLTALATVVASRRAHRGILTFVVCCIAGFAAVPLTTRMGGSGLAAGSVALLVPVLALLWAATTQNSAARAAQSGRYGGFKRCPYCAESVRAEAIKCKHCGSDLTADAVATTGKTER